jgi:hypothetical protein
MTQDEIIEMAKQSGLNGWEISAYKNEIQHFAKLVAQHEREACAEVCKKHADVYALLEQNPHAFGTAKPAWAACIDNRDAIRARGQA